MNNMCHRVVEDDDYEVRYQYVYKSGDEIIDIGDANKDQIFSKMYHSLESHGIVFFIKREIVNARAVSPKYDLSFNIVLNNQTLGSLRIKEISASHYYHFLLVIKFPTETITWEIDC
jgi:hypothetical protein